MTLYQGANYISLICMREAILDQFLANAATVPVSYQQEAALKFCFNSPRGSRVSSLRHHQQKQISLFVPLFNFVPTLFHQDPEGTTGQLALVLSSNSSLASSGLEWRDKACLSKKVWTRSLGLVVWEVCVQEPEASIKISTPYSEKTEKKGACI